MTRRPILILAAAAIALLPHGSQAAPQSRTYVAGPGGNIFQRSNVPGTNGVGIGGATFDPTSDPVSVRVNDTAGAGKVLFKVCQPACSAEGAVLKAYCVNNNSTQTLPASFNSVDELVYVFIYTEETVASVWQGSIPCPDAVATTGTVTLT